MAVGDSDRHGNNVTDHFTVGVNEVGLEDWTHFKIDFFITSARELLKRNQIETNTTLWNKLFVTLKPHDS